MPIAHIHMMEGRTDEQKAAVIEKVTDALCEAVDAPRQNVRVLIQEVPNTQFGIGGVTAKSLER